MKVALHDAGSKYDRKLMPLLEKGFRRNGCNVWRFVPDDGIAPNADLAVFIGVKSLALYKKYTTAGVKTLLVDKGYFGRGEYFRMSLGGFQPFYFGDLCRVDLPDRLRQVGVRLCPKRSGDLVIYTGSSQKFHNWHGLGDAHEYATEICLQLRYAAKFPKHVVYRPKPSWWAKIPQDQRLKLVPTGVSLSHNTELLSQLLPHAHCVVTYGSNAAVEALAAGVPVLLTSPRGVSPVYDMAELSVDNVMNPAFPDDETRRRTLNAVAWCQFSESEIASGFAWNTINEHAKVLA